MINFVFEIITFRSINFSLLMGNVETNISFNQSAFWAKHVDLGMGNLHLYFTIVA